MATTKTKRVIEIDVTTNKGLQQGIRQVNSQLRSIEGSAQRTGREVQRMGRSFNFMALATKAFIAIRVAKYVTDISDSMTLLSARTALVAENTVGTEKAMSDLFDVSEKTRSSIDASASLYARLGLATKSLGVSHEDLISVVQTTANTLVLSGAGAQEAKASMIQLSQAFAKGKLDGDEFRTMTENNVYMFDLLARQMGVTRRELYAMSKAGELTTDKVFGVLRDSVDETQQKMDKIPFTFGHAFTLIKNELSKLALEFEDTFQGITQGIIDSIQHFSVMKRFISAIDDELLPQSSYADIFDLEKMQSDLKKLESISGDFGAATLGRVSAITYELNELEPKIERLTEELDNARKSAASPIGFDIFDDSFVGNIVRKYQSTDIKFLNAQLGKATTTAKELRTELTELLTPKEKTKIKVPVVEQLSKDELAILDYIESVVKANDASELLLDKLEALDDLYQRGAINADVFASENEKLEKSLLGVEKQTDKVETALDEMGVAIGNTLAKGVGEIGDALFDYMVGIETSFKQTITNIIEDIGRLIVQITLLNGLKAGLSGTGAGAFLFPSASANGNVFQNGAITPFATGGVVDSPVLFPMANGTGLMGEAGPEAILPLKRGSDGKLGVTAEGGGAAKSVSVTIENKGSTDSEVVQSTATTDVNGTVVNIILDDIRRGGPLRESLRSLR